jgi:uncharacterized protein (DUF1330 family)
MAKGYWIARVDVTNPDAYKKYVEGTVEAFEKYGARFLARGGRTQALEGVARARNVVTEFDSLELAVACYNSPEYQRAKAFRDGAAEAEIVVVEGVT